MLINSTNNIQLSVSLDDNMLRSLQTYHKLLRAVEPYQITSLARLDEYLEGLTIYEKFVNCNSDCSTTSRIYNNDEIIRYRLANYIESKQKNAEMKKENYKHPELLPPPLPLRPLVEITYSALIKFVDYNRGRNGDIDNIADFEKLFAQQDMILQYQLHTDRLLLSRIYSYIKHKEETRCYLC